MSNQYRHIHIVGCSPRSGTTLLAELFRTCFDVDGFYDHEKSIFKCTPWKHQVMVSKSATEAIYFPWLLNINPNLWCVYVLRDPRDAITSTHQHFPDQFLSNLRIWKTYHRAATRSMGHPRFFCIKYEDLVTNPDIVQERLVSAFPFLQVKSKFSSYGEQTTVSNDSKKALNGVRPINTQSIGRWKKYPGRIKRQIQLHGDITQALIDLGYENDADWEKILDSVDPDTKPGALPDFPSWHKTLRVKYRVLRKLIFYSYLIHVKNLWGY